MTEDRDIEAVETALRAAGPPLDPPAGFDRLARDAALGDRPQPVVSAGRERPSRRPMLWRAVLAAAVIGISAAAALLIGVGGDAMQVDHTIALQGQGGASGTVEIGEPDGSTREVVVKVDDLAPAPEGRYYALYMSDDGHTMPLAAFNTDEDGSADVHSTMPAEAGWTDCWVTLTGGTGDEQPVLRAESS
jgi:hypothetical protein